MSKPAEQRLKLDTSEWASPQEYNALIRSLQLQDIRMVSGKFTAAERYEGQGPALTAGIHSRGRFQLVDGGFIAYYLLQLGATRPKAKAPVIRVEAEYALQYRTEIRITKELFLPFVHLNLPVQAWPYFREFVQSTTARLQWPQLSLPSLHSTGASLDLTPGIVDVEVEDAS